MTTERQKNGPSDLLPNQPLQFSKSTKLSSPNPLEDQRCNKTTRTTMKIDSEIVDVRMYYVFCSIQLCELLKN